MASSGGPRVAGSGRADEGKFRQRVDTHYRLMAEAKKKIASAGRLALAAALGFTSIAGVAATQPGEASIATALIAGVLALTAGVTGRAATAAAGNREAEKHAAAFKRWSRSLAMILFLTLLAAGMGQMAGLTAPQKSITIAMGCIWTLALAASAVGLHGSVGLLYAFEQQKSKAQKK